MNLQLLQESSKVPNAMGLYILNEETATEVEFKPISENKNGFITAEAQLQRGDEKNRNRRIYPTAELKRGIRAPRIVELVKSGNLKGEAGHPLDTSLIRQQSIFPTLEQVWYTKLWMEGDVVKAHVRGTNNDLGRSFNDDLKDGQKPSFSLRGVGVVVNENGTMRVKNLQMITYDRVYYPSHSNAYVTKLLVNESGNILDNPSLKESVMESLPDYRQQELRFIQEQGNGLGVGTDIINESTKLYSNDEHLVNYIREQSDVVKQLNEQYGLDNPDIQIGRNGDVVMTNSIGDKFVVNLEEAVTKSIYDDIDKFF